MSTSAAERLPPEVMSMFFSFLPLLDICAVSRMSRSIRSLVAPLLFRHITLIENNDTGYADMLRQVQQFAITFVDNLAYGPYVCSLTIRISQHAEEAWSGSDASGDEGWANESYRYLELNEPVNQKEIDERLARMDGEEQQNTRRLLAIVQNIGEASPNLALNGFAPALVLLLRQLPNIVQLDYYGSLLFEPLALSAIGFFPHGVPQGLQSLRSLTLTHEDYDQFSGGFGLYMIRALFNLPRLESLVVERLGFPEQPLHSEYNSNGPPLAIPPHNHTLKNLLLFGVYSYQVGEISNFLRPLRGLVSAGIVFNVDPYLDDIDVPEAEEESEGESVSDDESEDKGDPTAHIMHLPRRFLGIFRPSASTLERLFIGSVTPDLSGFTRHPLHSLRRFPNLVHVRLPVSWISGDFADATTVTLERLPRLIQTIHLDLDVGALPSYIPVLNTRIPTWKTMAPKLDEILVFWHGKQLSYGVRNVLRAQLKVHGVRAVPSIDDISMFSPTSPTDASLTTNFFFTQNVDHTICGRPASMIKRMSTWSMCTSL